MYKKGDIVKIVSDTIPGVPEASRYGEIGVVTCIEGGDYFVKFQYNGYSPLLLFYENHIRHATPEEIEQELLGEVLMR